MKTLIDQLMTSEKKHVVVVGDIMLDEYLFGDVSRVSPEAPVPVVKKQRYEWYLGGAANVAANCAKLGLHVDLVSIINKNDYMGQQVIKLLENVQVNPAHLVRSENRITTTKRRVIANNHHCLRIDEEDTHLLAADEYEQIIAYLDRLITPTSVVLISDYAKGVVTSNLINFLVKKAQLYTIPVIVDPKGPDFEKYKGVRYIKPNAHEFKQMTAAFGVKSDMSLVDQARQLCIRLKLEGLMITLGEEGIAFITATEEWYAPACKQEVFDLSGAGDTVFACFALGIAHSLAISDMLTLANKAAAVAISHLKTYAVSLRELIDEPNDLNEKIVYDWQLLKERLDKYVQQGKKIVFTNGCFDIFHAGHVQLLTEACKAGDVLVVAINSDQSVKLLGKGDNRPINKLVDRARVVAALEAVDFVTMFEQPTPYELIKYLQPDVLVKGGDYHAEEVVGYQVVTERGGIVKIIPLLLERSTTHLLARGALSVLPER